MQGIDPGAADRIIELAGQVGEQGAARVSNIGVVFMPTPRASAMRTTSLSIRATMSFRISSLRARMSRLIVTCRGSH
jgi:hypothetical protein